MSSRTTRATVAVVAAFLALTGMPARATATLRSFTATTTLGRTCTVVFQGDSTSRVTPVSSRIDYASSLSCTAPGGSHMFSFWADQNVYENVAYGSPEWVRNVVAQDVGNAVGGPGLTGTGCSNYVNHDACSFAQHTYGYPGDLYGLHSHAAFETPYTSSSSSAERWTSYPSGCSAWVGAIDPQGTKWSGILECSYENAIRAF